MELNERIVITDIGSTTTKAILLIKENQNYSLIDYETYPTTVEKPFEDVKIGVFHAIKKLEEKTRMSILQMDATSDHILFNKGFDYLTTSSAGGGLQIVVIGLTKADSALSAQKAAYGVGGVLLDTLAVDDKRSTIEQMNLLNHLHPDIILFSGGVDGGALFSVIRIAEILNLSELNPKFNDKSKIPLVYAGNQEANHFIEALFKEKFDLHIVKNLRPTMLLENLKPASDKIHELFMENVMEQAPGYHDIKKIVSDPIIPTPTGVLCALKLISQSMNKNILAFDIGGATTDFFSNIHGKFYRTVSANYGMSYSIANVLADTGAEKVWDYLKEIFPDQPDSKNYIMNYIGNKMLNPDHVPINEYETVIEIVMAIQAISLSKNQHLDMNFSMKKTNFLNKIKSINRDPFYDTFYADKLYEGFEFNFNQIDVMIGAGGIISNVSKETALIIINESLKPQGITEIWRDKYFLTPHLGKLSQTDQNTAFNILQNDCFEKIATVISPVCKTFKKDKKLMTICIESHEKTDEYDIWGDDLLYIPHDKHKSVTITFHSGCILNHSLNSISFETSNPLLIDTRDKKKTNFRHFLDIFKNYHFMNDLTDLNLSFKSKNKNSVQLIQNKIKELHLPYPGNIHVSPGQEVQPDTIIGENRFEPPKLYIVNCIANLGITPTPDEIRKNILVNPGDSVKINQKVFSIKPEHSILGAVLNYYSPVRGIVEQINYETGMIILREIQDYALEPIEIDIAEKLNIKPRYIKGYLKKSLGDFVYQGESLDILNSKLTSQIISPCSGLITDINTKKGTITIHYDKKSIVLYANCFGKITSTIHNKNVSIEVNAEDIEAKIGFGKSKGGYLSLYSEKKPLEYYQNKIVVYPNRPDQMIFNQFTKNKIAGLIIPSANFSDICTFLGKEIGVALTGEEELPFSIIITEGFGLFSFSAPIYQLFTQKEGCYTSLSPQTQIRAGVIRPRISFFNQKISE